MSLEFSPTPPSRPLSAPAALRGGRQLLRSIGSVEHASLERDWRAAFRVLRGLASAHSPLLANPQSLADHLYAHWFHGLLGESRREYPEPGEFAVATEASFEFEPAQIVSIEADACAVETQRGKRLRVSFGDLQPKPAWSNLVAGLALEVRPRCQSAHSGFWHLWSQAWATSAPQHIERLYLGISRGAEVAVAARIARHAPQSAVWYCKFLCGVHPQGRRDTALLYLPQLPARPAWLLELLDACAPHFREAPVRCTQRLRCGVYSARDPGNGLSFGQHVCHAVSQASAEAGALASYARFRYPLAAFMDDYLKSMRPST